MEFAEPTNVNVGNSTSSLDLMPKQRRERCKAEVPFTVAITCFALVSSDSIFSNLSDQKEIWSMSGELDILISCQPFSSEKNFYDKEFINIVENNPKTNIIIEHLGGIGINGSVESFKKFLDIAKYPNIYIKVPGLGEVLNRPKILKPQFSFQKQSEYFGLTLDAFGSERMMWGSDYPPSAGREGYRNTMLGIIDNPIFSEIDVKNIMGLTAKKLLNL